MPASKSKDHYYLGTVKKNYGFKKKLQNCENSTFFKKNNDMFLVIIKLKFRGTVENRNLNLTPNCGLLKVTSTTPLD